MSTSSGPCEQLIAENLTASKKFVRIVTLPTLQEMASFRIALSIWHYYTSSHSKQTQVEKKSNDFLVRVLGLGEKYWEECDKMVESLKMPTSIEQAIKSAMESMHEETMSWITHFQCDTFSDDMAIHRIEQFDADWCVWLPDGKVNYVKTASKMLQTSQLSPVQRFAIMSEFCMENEIQKFSLRSLPDSFIAEVDFYHDFLIYYWIRYLKNELDAIPLRNYTSIDMLMADTCETRYWTAFEYFWNRLGDDDQVTVAEFWLSNYNTQAYQDLVLSKMSWHQQHRLLSVQPDQILLNFWIRLSSPESAMWTWNASKDHISPEQFGRIVYEVFYRKVPFENEMRLFLEMWHSASNQQRNHVVRSMENEIITPFFCISGHCKAALEFLFVFLSMKSEESRRKVMLQNAGEFGANIEDPNLMNEIIRLCLPNPADVLECKELIMESHDMLIRAVILFNNVELEKLTLKVKSYSTDATMSKEFLNRLLQWRHVRKMQYFISFEKWNKFSQFVDEIYSQDVTSALNLKKQFITSYAQVCQNDWNEDTLDETIKILETVLTTNDELQLVKKYLLDSFRKLFFDYDYWPWFDEKYFNQFVSWCLNENKQSVAEFIRNMPVDDIFNAYFRQLEDWYWDSDGFDQSILDGLDNCLRWYFKGVEGAKAYKLGRMTTFEEIELIRLILQRKDESSLDLILKWSFDGDEEGVRQFKSDKIRLRDE